MKELFALIEKMIKEGLLPGWGEITVKWEGGKVVIAKETKSIKP